jgi:hypothetical protein
LRYTWEIDSRIFCGVFVTSHIPQDGVSYVSLLCSVPVCSVVGAWQHCVYLRIISDLQRLGLTSDRTSQVMNTRYLNDLISRSMCQLDHPKACVASKDEQVAADVHQALQPISSHHPLPITLALSKKTQTPSLNCGSMQPAPGSKIPLQLLA